MTKERFLERVSKTESCWIWVGGRASNGYGMTRFLGKQMGAHRASWLAFRGAIPPKISVLHRCDNPPCVNPEHLFLGTQKENMRDKIQKGREYQSKKTHCPSKHPYSGENLFYAKDGRRKCRECSRERARRQRARASA